MRMRTEPPAGTAGKRATTTSASGGISSSSPVALFVNASPFTVSTWRSSPVSRLRAEGDEALLPVRTTFR